MTKHEEKSFTFVADTSTDVPLWVQLKNRLAYLIASGYYAPGEQLPTVRSLASDISINYNTVNKAYLALKSEGFIESTRGRGAFVRDLDQEVDQEFSTEVDSVLDECVAACRALGLSPDDIRLCMEDDRHEGHGRIITIEIGPVAEGKRHA